VSHENGPQSASIPVEGPLAGRGGAGRSRRDAARNTGEVLRAARALFAREGVAAVSMDRVAAEAGVGKGTVYRVAGSRAGLAELLLDDAERALQDGILTGPPPLGSGAPAGERLGAFVEAYVRFLDGHAELLAETERTGGGRYATGAYAFWHTHVRGLLDEAGVTAPALAADLVLALLGADVHDHLRRTRGASVEAVAAATRRITAALVAAPAP
jgi:AcrR family transcriptional regulator